MAIWSKIWTDHPCYPNTPAGCSGKLLRRLLLEEARFMKPAPVKSKKGGKFPHLQPFFRNVKKA